MSFDSRKALVGQDIATIIDLELDRCKHTTAQSVSDGKTTLNTALTDTQTGSITIGGGNVLVFVNSIPYARIEGELVKVDVVSNTELTITARGQFGTTAVSHSSGIQIEVIHSGEADGTCYGFPQTCSSPDSYDADTKMLFRFPSTQLDLSEIFYTGFKSWSHSPVKLDPGQSIGKRASVSFNIADSVDHDIYVPYADRRTAKGTLFTKLLARHPNIEGRPLKVRTGFDPRNFDESNFITREYIIDKVDLKDGVFSGSALDPLILTESKKAKAPRASDGRLAVAIDDTSTQITYKDAPAFDYGASGTVFVRIDSEEIECTVNSNFVLDIVTRGAGGTEQKDHDINATVQYVLVYTSMNVVDIITDLITNYTNTPSRFLGDYSDTISKTSSILLSAHITKPVEVEKLLNELVKCGDLNLYYDEERQQIQIKTVSDSSAQPISINEDEHIRNASISRDPDEQYTRYSVAWGVNNVTKSEDEENFSIVYQAINANLELEQSKGETNEKDIFYNRWLTTSDTDVTIGTSIAQRLLDRSEELPEVASFELDVESVFNTQGSSLELGSVISLETSRAVEVDGSNKARNHQIISLKDMGNMIYQVTSKLFQDPILGINLDFTISENKENYDLSTEFAPSAGHYIVILEKGVTIGSNLTAQPAFTTGTQASGVSFTFIILGSILGMGGRGGDGGVCGGDFADYGAGQPGYDGGNALEATVPLTLQVGSGALWAGGGGSAGQPSEVTGKVGQPVGRPGNGGSGGQGYGVSGFGQAGATHIDSEFPIEGQPGQSGNRGAPGQVGDLSGGAFGQDGDSTDASGGLSGYAIVSNGNTITISNGNNNLNIKGRQS